MISSFVPKGDKHHSRLMQLEQAIRYELRTNKQMPGLRWISSRTMTRNKLFRGSTEIMCLVRELVAGGHIGRATARGAGRGKGRTLYWLPSTKKWLVLQELRRENMPHSALDQALGFFARKERIASAENVTDQARQQSLSSSNLGTDTEKGRARPRQDHSPPSWPLRQASRGVSPAGNTPPSDRRLAKHGSGLERLRTEQLEAALERMRRHVLLVVPDPAETTRRAELEPSVAPSRSHLPP